MRVCVCPIYSGVCPPLGFVTPYTFGACSLYNYVDVSAARVAQQERGLSTASSCFFSLPHHLLPAVRARETTSTRPSYLIFGRRSSWFRPLISFAIVLPKWRNQCFEEPFFTTHMTCAPQRTEFCRQNCRFLSGAAGCGDDGTAAPLATQGGAPAAAAGAGAVSSVPPAVMMAASAQPQAVPEGVDSSSSSSSSNNSSHKASSPARFIGCRPGADWFAKVPRTRYSRGLGGCCGAIVR